MQHETNSFILRIWFELVDKNGKIQIWRGSIEHVNSGHRRSFQDLATATDFIQEQSGIQTTQKRNERQSLRARFLARLQRRLKSDS